LNSRRWAWTLSAPLAVAYTDHLLLEADHRNADDHVLLESAARRFGMWYSRAGNGISHAVHYQLGNLNEIRRHGP
jgi:aconitase A